MKIRYEANDGRVFDTKEACFEYEQTKNHLENTLKNIVAGNFNRRRINLAQIYLTNDENSASDIFDNNVYYIYLSNDEEVMAVDSCFSQSSKPTSTGKWYWDCDEYVWKNIDILYEDWNNLNNIFSELAVDMVLGWY